MNQKLQKFIRPGLPLFMVVMACFAVVSFFVDWRLAVAEGAALVVLALYSLATSRRRHRELVDYMESITYDITNAKNDTLLHFPLPMWSSGWMTTR